MKCVDCKYFSAGNVGLVDIGECLRSKEPGAKMSIMKRESDDVWLVVEPDFGCVQFEVK